jgi:hypothetical protein
LQSVKGNAEVGCGSKRPLPIDTGYDITLSILLELILPSHLQTMSAAQKWALPALELSGLPLIQGGEGLLLKGKMPTEKPENKSSLIRTLEACN